MMNFLKLPHDPLSVDEITNLVTSSSCGAISVFVGTTRDNFEDKTVVHLEYEAYEAMALKTLESICQEIRKQWPAVENIAIYHRLGKVPVKESSIIIAISSPHRSDAIKATEWCINKVKSSVTIWKKEIYDKAEPEWKENRESLPHPPKRRLFCPKIEQHVEIKSIPPHLVNSRLSHEECFSKRIDNFIKLKRNEINENNKREFFAYNQTDNLNSRTHSTYSKKKDSKSHLQVNEVLNTYNRDQTSSKYMMKYIPTNGMEERIESLEIQLSLFTPVPRNIYKRLKTLEERMLHLEAISPEYIQLWEKVPFSTKKNKKKKIFSIEEIDSIIENLTKEMEEKSHED